MCIRDREPACAASQLQQWPVQIKLVPVNAPYFDGADLLIAADCTAYAYADFHRRFIKGHITPVSYTHLDVYKRQVGDGAFEFAHDILGLIGQKNIAVRVGIGL